VLERRSSWEPPLDELSALAVRLDGTGATELVAVDDDRWNVAIAAMSASGLSPGQAREVNAGECASPPGSEFEGVASDASGRRFVLREGAARILVLDGELNGVEQTILLRVAPDEPGFGPEWNDLEKANSRAEGLLLLRGGHVLVAKQREPVRLIEFGPGGEAARGFAPGTALGSDDVFEIGGSRTVELEVLASWGVDHNDVRSINDFAVDGDGRLYLVSSKSRSVSRLKADLEPRGGGASLDAYALPDDLFETEEDKAEGLVFTPELGWLVGLDLKRSAPNIFQIAGVPEP
jgi:hypothetical protein